MFIYGIVNMVNFKIYVGQTRRTVEERFAEHARSKKSLIGKAIREYGVENFKVETLAECDNRQELNRLEQFWIKTLNCKSPNGYNCNGGGGRHSNFSPSAETRAKLSAALMGHPVSEQTRKKISAINKGRKHTPEARAKISEAGRKHHPSAETRAKISASLMGHPVSEETRAKISAKGTGKKQSAETIAKRSASLRKWRAQKH